MKDTTNSEFTLESTINLPIIESAGGLVCNKHFEVLLMFKRGKWDMPKGRIENIQTKEECALREVHEETGLDISKLSITGKLVSTWHTTSHGGIKYLKKTHWYLMQYDCENSSTAPQVEEGIIECRWVPLSELPKYRESLRTRVEYVVDFWHKNLAYAPKL